ncbi:S-layer homology domain-containing protein [Sporosarcina sp. SAFN-010]|uniref:S-layer homology domain-containing protein n=1 Tax=Sporosarcina sp. SAFN-010 TaxID=3387273 RepID=UPI003F814A9E
MEKLKFAAIILALSLIGLFFNTHSVFAETNGNLQFDEKTTISLTPENPTATYTINLPEPGKLTGIIEAYFEHAPYQIKDENGVDVVNDFLYLGTSSTPTIKNLDIHLEAGQYTVEFQTSNIWPEGVMQRNFSFLPKFTPAGNNEKEPNNVMEQAELLPLTNFPIRGFLSWSDPVDYYKIQLDEAGKLSFDSNMFIRDCVMTLLDETSATIIQKHFIKGNEFSPEKYSDSIYLEAGTYYIKVGESSKRLFNGVYTLQARFDAANSHDVEPNNSIELAQVMPIGKDFTGLMSWNDQVDYYQFVASNTTFFTLSAIFYFNDCEIEVRNSDGTRLLNKSIYGSSEKNPQQLETSLDVTKGTYFIKIQKSAGSSKPGLYKLSIKDPAARRNFTDVSSAYQDAVDYLVNNNIAKGTSRTTFGISDNVKRIDAAVMLAKALGINGSKTSTLLFKDVPSRATGAVKALSEQGIMKGKSATSFGSNDQLTRGEIALILTRAYKLDGKGTSTNFTDVSATYKPAVDALVKNKITQGKSPSTFGTTDPITRGEIAIFLYRVSLLKQ